MHIRGGEIRVARGYVRTVTTAGGEAAEHGLVVEVTAPGETLVTVTGEHDLACRDADRMVLLALVARHELVVVDVTRAEFLDVGFATTLILAGEAAVRRGHELRLFLGMLPPAKLVLEASGVLDAVSWEEA